MDGVKNDQNSGGENISDRALVFFNNFSFSEHIESFNPSKVPPETVLREVTRFVSNKIKDYLYINREDAEVLNYLRSKLSEEELKKFIEGEFYRDLIDAKTLYRYFNASKLSETTLNIFRAFRKAILQEGEDKKQLQRVEGYYLVYNSHNTFFHSFQISIIEINSEGKSRIRFRDRNFQVVEKELDTLMVGNDRVLLNLREKNLLMTFYIYVSSDQMKPPFVQGVFLYANRANITIANLVVFERLGKDFTQEKFNAFEPERQLESLTEASLPPPLEEEEEKRKETNIFRFGTRENIQYYLLNKTNPIVPITYKTTEPFNFSKDTACYPSLHQTEAKHYNRARSYIGDYFIYFNERFSSTRPKDKHLGINPFFSTVGRGVLTIEADKSSGVLKCKMRTQKNNDKAILEHSGHIINHTLNTGDVIIIALYLDTEKDRYLNLLLNVIDEKRFVGNFSITYSYPRALGCGTIVMIRQESILQEKRISEKEAPPEDWEPSSFYVTGNNSASRLEQNILNFLSDNLKSRTIPPEFNQIKNYQPNIYQGVYYMYQYQYDNPSLERSILQINGNGWAIHLNPNKELTYGRVENNGSILNILLKNQETGRSGFCCIKVGNNIAPRKGVPDGTDRTIYLGTFAGVSGNEKEIPLASKFVLEFLEREASIADYEQEAQWLEDSSEEVMENIFMKKLVTALGDKTQFGGFTFEAYTRKGFIDGV